MSAPAPLKDFLKQLKAMQDAGRLAEAEALCEAGLREAPGHPGMLQRYAELAEQRGRAPAAETEARWRTAHQAAPGAPAPLAGLARNLSAQARWPEAAQVCRAALARGPARPMPLWSLLGQAARQKQDWPTVLEAAREVLALQPEHLPAHLQVLAALQALNRTADAGQHLNRWCEGPHACATAWRRRAQWLADQGQDEAALRDWARAWAEDPAEPLPLVRTAATCLRLGRLDEGQWALDALRAQFGDTPECLQMEAQWLAAQGHPDEAWAHFAAAAARHPMHGGLVLAAARHALRHGPLEGAEALLARRLEAPDSGLPEWQMLATLRERREDQDGARAAWQRVHTLATAPGASADALLQHAAAWPAYLARTGDFAASETALSALLERPEWSPEWFSAAIELGHQSGHFEVALRALAKGLAVAPQFWSTMTPESRAYALVRRMLEVQHELYQAHRMREALTLLTESLGAGHVMTPLWEAMTLRAECRFTDAAQRCETQLKHLPEACAEADAYRLELSLIHWFSMNNDASATWARAVRTHKPPLAGAARSREAQAMICAGREESLVPCLEALLTDPAEADTALGLLGKIQFARYQDPEALDRLAHLARSRGLAHPTLYVYAALELSRIGEAARADAWLRHAEQLFPNENFVHGARMNLLTREGQGKAALQVLNDMYAREGFAPVRSTHPEHQLTIQHLACDGVADAASTGTVSVIMTTYRRDEMLPVAIRSILQQTYRDLELIIVDDCSPDDNLAWLREQARSDPRIRVLQPERNGGTYRAKNLGLQHATGTYLSFMDSDDWLHPQALERQIRLLESRSLQGVLAAYFRVGSDGLIEYRPQSPMGLGPITLCMRRDPVFQRLGYFDCVRSAADSEYLTRLNVAFGASAVDWIRAPLLVSTRHEQSLTGGSEFAFSWWGPGEMRREYAYAARPWLTAIAQGADPYLPAQPAQRPFPAPALLTR